MAAPKALRSGDEPIGPALRESPADADETERLLRRFLQEGQASSPKEPRSPSFRGRAPAGKVGPGGSRVPNGEVSKEGERPAAVRHRVMDLNVERRWDSPDDDPYHDPRRLGETHGGVRHGRQVALLYG